MATEELTLQDVETLGQVLTYDTFEDDIITKIDWLSKHPKAEYSLGWWN